MVTELAAILWGSAALRRVWFGGHNRVAKFGLLAISGSAQAGLTGGVVPMAGDFIAGICSGPGGDWAGGAGLRART